MNGGWGISCEIALRWMQLDLTDDKSTLVQVMAWCCQATSHYLSQCWPRSRSPNVITRPQWVNSSPPRQNGHHFADNIFRCIFVNKKFCIFIKISLQFAPNGPIDNNQALAEIMAWCLFGPVPSHYLNHWWPDSLTHICATRGRWVKLNDSFIHAF